MLISCCAGIASSGAMLKHSCVVGNSHWEAGTIGDKSARLPGPKPKLFFAPGYKVKGTDCFFLRFF